jgi:hypothetical protein
MVSTADLRPESTVHESSPLANGEADDGGRSHGGERTTTSAAASSDAATRPRKHMRKRRAASCADAPLVDVSTSVAGFHSGRKPSVLGWRWSGEDVCEGAMFWEAGRQIRGGQERTREASPWCPRPRKRGPNLGQL